jgi:VIT1/CCC1 family predicted Fe2+/Mn2+ transporter
MTDSTLDRLDDLETHEYGDERRVIPDQTSLDAAHESLSTTPNKTEHLGSSRQYWRDIILGVNDGLVSTFLLVAGVAGGGLASRDILLTAIAGAIAGAVSMAAGEYVATKSQNEVMQGEIDLEKTHIALFLDDELCELDGLMDLIGISQGHELRGQMRDYYETHPDNLLQIMVALEFGVLNKENRSPITAALFSGSLFIWGALPSVVPFAFSGDKPRLGLVAAAVLTVAGLMFVGSVKTWATRTNFMTSSLENLVIAGFGGGLAYGVGLLFDKVV